MNLVVNARDAMPNGGTLTLTTDVVEVGAGDAADLPAGRWVMFSVADTGTGIREDARAHLFEPFFTTKELGRGTGLGLSTVYGIVRTAGGQLRYETAPGRGTTFRVYLPVAKDESDRAGANHPGNGARSSPPAAPIQTHPAPGPSAANGTARALCACGYSSWRMFRKFVRWRRRYFRTRSSPSRRPWTPMTPWANSGNDSST